MLSKALTGTGSTGINLTEIVPQWTLVTVRKTKADKLKTKDQVSHWWRKWNFTKQTSYLDRSCSLQIALQIPNGNGKWALSSCDTAQAEPNATLSNTVGAASCILPLLFNLMALSYRKNCWPQAKSNVWGTPVSCQLNKANALMIRCTVQKSVSLLMSNLNIIYYFRAG